MKLTNNKTKNKAIIKLSILKKQIDEYLLCSEYF